MGDDGDELSIRPQRPCNDRVVYFYEGRRAPRGGTMKLMAGVGALALAGGMAAQAAGPAVGSGFLALRELRRDLRALGITDAQKEQIRSVLRAHRDEHRAAADRLWQAVDKVEAAARSDSPDEVVIRERVKEASVAAGDLVILRSKVRGEIRGLLSPDQRDGADRIRGKVKARLREWRAGARLLADDALLAQP